MKKANRIFALCIVAALPQLAMAGDSPSSTLGLDVVYGILVDYCAKADPRDAQAFDAIWKSILSEAAQNQREYKPTFTFNGSSDANGTKICSVLASSWKASTYRPTNGVEDQPEHPKHSDGPSDRKR